MLDLARADAESEGAERAVRRSVRVAADDCRSRQCPALLRPHDVHDALADVAHGQIFDAEFAGVCFECRDLLCGFRIGDSGRAVGGRHIVIGDRERQIGTADLSFRVAETLEGLRARHFVDEMAIDIKHTRFALRLMDEMRIPDFVVKRLCHIRCPVDGLDVLIVTSRAGFSFSGGSSNREQS
jgi:hypothetical protein